MRSPPRAQQYVRWSHLVGGLLDLGNRHRPRGQEAKHNATPQGTRRSPSCQRLTLLGPTPNSWATRCCAMPSAPSVARNSVVGADRFCMVMPPDARPSAAWRPLPATLSTGAEPRWPSPSTTAPSLLAAGAGAGPVGRLSRVAVGLVPAKLKGVPGAGF